MCARCECPNCGTPKPILAGVLGTQDRGIEYLICEVCGLHMQQPFINEAVNN